MTDDLLSSDSKGDTGTPRWVKVFAIVFLVLVLLGIVVILAGGHGPGVHTP